MSIFRTIGKAFWLVLSLGVLIGGIAGFFIAKHRYQVTPVAPPQAQIIAVAETPKEEAPKPECYKVDVVYGNTLSQIVADLGQDMKFQDEVAKLNGMKTKEDQNWIYVGEKLILPAGFDAPAAYAKVKAEREKKSAAKMTSPTPTPAHTDVEPVESDVISKTDLVEAILETEPEVAQEIKPVMVAEVPAMSETAPILLPVETLVATVSILTDKIGNESHGTVINVTRDERGEMKTSTTELPQVALVTVEEEAPKTATQKAYELKVPTGTIAGMKPGLVKAAVLYQDKAGYWQRERTVMEVKSIDGGYSWNIPYNTEFTETPALAFDMGDGVSHHIPSEIVESKAKVVWQEPNPKVKKAFKKRSYNSLFASYPEKQSKWKKIGKVTIKVAPIVLGIAIQGPVIGGAIGVTSLITSSVKERSIKTQQIESLAGKLDSINDRLTALEKEKESK